MGSTEIEFTGGAGARLIGLLHEPDAPARGGVLMAHCFTCSQELHTSTRLARNLVQGGYMVLTFDFTGLGRSGGDFAETSVSSNIADMTRAAVALIERNRGPCVLLGHSLGGAAAVLAASRLHTIRAVVAIASPASVGHVRHLTADARPGDEPGRLSVDIGGRPFVIGQQFLDDLESHDLLAAASALRRPLLVVEAGADTVVGTDQTRALAEAGSGDLVVIDGADHLFSDRSHADQLGESVLDWLDATL